MRIARKTTILLTVIAILSLTTTTLAVLYMTKTVTFGATVKQSGEIQVLQYGTTTEITAIDFGEYISGDQTKTFDITIKNKATSNVQVKISWKLNPLPTNWVAEGTDSYKKLVSGLKYWQLEIYDITTGLRWTPSDLTGTNKYFTLAIGASKDFMVSLTLKSNGFLALDNISAIPMEFSAESV